MTEAKWAVSVKDTVERHEVNVLFGPAGEPAALASGPEAKLDGVESWTMPTGETVVYFPGDYAGARGITPQTVVVEEVAHYWQAENLLTGDVEAGLAANPQDAFSAAVAVTQVPDKVAATRRVVLLDASAAVLADIPDAKDVGNVLIDKRRQDAADRAELEAVAVDIKP